MTAPLPLNDELVQSATDRALQQWRGAGQPSPSQANQALEPNAPENVEADEAKRALLRALYGSDFPLLREDAEPDPQDWVRWVKNRWTVHDPAVQTHQHLVQRNRLFRAGQQWVSSTNGGSWREPMKPKESSRRTDNRIGPALDLRQQILADQRPGFKLTPASLDPTEQQRAEARQTFLDYHYDAQLMDAIRDEATFWNQTDGVSFWHVFWDPDKGSWDDRMGQNGGAPLGDLTTETLRCEQVRVSANATATVPPYYTVIRKAIPAIEAAARWGAAGAVAAGSASEKVDDSMMGQLALQWSTIGEADRMRAQETTDYYRIYCAPQPDALPNGLDIVIVGDTLVVGPLDLYFGAIPVIPVRDGSTDPSYYPRPIMEAWVPHQQAINMVLSRWTDSVRVNSGGRFFGRPNSIAQETFIGGITSIIEVKGAGPLTDSLIPVPYMSVGEDAKELLALDTKAIENRSGDNDTTRGQIQGDPSGRAILATRELVERIFSPPVRALAAAFTQWAKICLRGGAWGYDVERTLKVVGATRPDLARKVSKDDLAGVEDVKVEAVTLMPLPFTLRQYLLDSWLERGIITPAEYRRRSPFASLSQFQTADDDQDARAQRMADTLLQGQQAPEIRWQDDESIHQDALDRRILLRDDIAPQIIAMADQRWRQLADQARQKTAMLAGVVSGGPPPAMHIGGGPSPFQQSPQNAPLAGGNPVGPPGAGAETTLQADAARSFEALAPH